MLSSEDFQSLRTVGELRAFVLRLKGEVTADDGERSQGILKKGLYKEFIDELLPLGFYASLIYPENYLVRPVLGNQGFDAIIYDENGQECDRVEITSPHDGQASAKDARLLVSRGYGAVVGGTPGDDFDALFDCVLSVCQDKALKDYNDCSLVVSIAPMQPFPGFETIHEQQIRSLVLKIAGISFKAKRVFLLVLPSRLELVPSSNCKSNA